MKLQIEVDAKSSQAKAWIENDGNTVAILPIRILRFEKDKITIEGEFNRRAMDELFARADDEMDF